LAIATRRGACASSSALIQVAQRYVPGGGISNWPTHRRALSAFVDHWYATWIRPGTISLPKGLWRKHTANGFTANALAPDTLTDLGGGACFNDARVQVEAAPAVH